ncbi:3-oxoacyl-ACP reductase [Aquitalea magnusonii]|nr:3-oxoacyl-ACP reductase [Aquitalea magnusonii]
MAAQAKTVVITGAGSGIGAACAALLAADGVQLVLIGRRAGPVQQLAAQYGALALAGDAADSTRWPGWLMQIHQRFCTVTGLLCCAGGLGMGSALDTDDAAWQAAMRANLDTAFVAARACLPDLIASRGAMVLLASIASLAAGPEVCGYTTAKHALIGLTRSLARDYGPHGVRVNAVCPGWVKTPMADEEMQPLMQQYGDSLDEAYARVTADVPLRRAAAPEEIASICRFLLSEQASIITGAAIVADGGSSIVDVPTLAFNALS